MRLTDILLSPNGRLSRAGFWGGYLTLGAITALGAVSLMSLSDTLARQPYGQDFIDPGLRPLTVGLVLLVPVLWMSFCLAVKRWHDRGRSGWWVLIGLVPVIGNLWGLIECGFLAGNRSGNKYGPAPLKGAAARHWHDDDIPEDMA